MLNPILGAWGTVVNKMDKNPHPNRAYVMVGEKRQ